MRSHRRLAERLRERGYDAIHVRDYAMQAADDEQVLERALIEGRIVVSVDTDFGTLLAVRRSAEPSVILFRGESTRAAERQANLLLANAEALKAALDAGCIAVFEASRIGLRTLPIA